MCDKTLLPAYRYFSSVRQQPGRRLIPFRMADCLFLVEVTVFYLSNLPRSGPTLNFL